MAAAHLAVDNDWIVPSFLAAAAVLALAFVLRTRLAGGLAVAATVLYRKLHDINVAKVLGAMSTVEYRDVAYAALFVAAGYFTLTFYDLFALRTIGQKTIPYRIAALAGFTSYSVGHNVGASVFTGGAVRYRIYSGWGLDAVEVLPLHSS